jgi:pimeloyl-ACP methyl ester carboxylesterase
MSAQEVRFDSGGSALAGTFAPVAEPVAAALLIPGSGRTDRDANARLSGGLTLRSGITGAVAQALGEAQVSTLRYDKRGVGASAGDYLRIGMAERLAEARAALGWLADQTAGVPLLVIGHSEGAYYAAQLAAEGRAAGIVLLSGSARRGEEVLVWQTAKVTAGLTPTARMVLRLLRTDVVRSQRKAMDRILASTDDVIRVQGRRMNARWLRDFAASEPAEALARVTVPVLAITGGHDLQVPPDDVDAVGRLVRGPFEGHVVGELSHVLRPDPDAVGPRGYRRAVREPVDPEVLRLVTDWVTGHWGRPAPDRAENALDAAGDR